MPNSEIVIKLLEENQKIIMTYALIENDYVENSINELENYYVSHNHIYKSISIFPCIPTSIIIDNKDIIYSCAKSFRRDATRLMEKLSSTFSINLETLDGLHQLKHKKSERQRGSLDSEWNYYFHGQDCRFENIKSGQVVEVMLMGKHEFGFLNSFYFYNYIKSTEEFNDLAKLLFNQSCVSKALDVLAIKGILAKVNSHIDIISYSIAY